MQHQQHPSSCPRGERKVVLPPASLSFTTAATDWSPLRSQSRGVGPAVRRRFRALHGVKPSRYTTREIGWIKKKKSLIILHDPVWSPPPPSRRRDTSRLGGGRGGGAGRAELAGLTFLCNERTCAPLSTRNNRPGAFFNHSAITAAVVQGLSLTNCLPLTAHPPNPPPPPPPRPLCLPFCAFLKARLMAEEWERIVFSGLFHSNCVPLAALRPAVSPRPADCLRAAAHQ